MIPFMALVSSIFNTDYSNTEHHSHQERLTWLNHEGLKYTLLLVMAAAALQHQLLV